MKIHGRGTKPFYDFLDPLDKILPVEIAAYMHQRLPGQSVGKQGIELEFHIADRLPAHAAQPTLRQHRSVRVSGRLNG